MEVETIENLAIANTDHLANLFATSDLVLIKKLSNNDRDWTRKKEKHQNGVYIPHERRDGGFFPPLKRKWRKRTDAKEIWDIYFRTIWPQLSSGERKTRLVHYTSKGQETHMTRLPKSAFSDLLPASYLVMGRFKSGNEFAYQCLTVDSGSDEAIFLRDLFGLAPDFVDGEFMPEKVRSATSERLMHFVEEVTKAWMNGKIASFAKESAIMPVTIDLARMAKEEFLKKNGLNNIDPFCLEAPGDVLREISRRIEWNIFREYQHRERSVELIRIVLGDKKRVVSAADIIRLLINQFVKVDALMLSAGQQRKSRAGYSYEHHIEAMLTDGGIPFEKQVIIESKKRPDFIIPSLKFLDSDAEGADTALVLSAKTTLRERWKQVEREIKGRRLFLTTVDENIAGNTIKDMASLGIHLVIPESLMLSRQTEYSGHENVISFKIFCEMYLKPNIERWKSASR